jgi:putative flavoprotein involved in K+ transport
MSLKRSYFPVIIVGGGQAGLAIGRELSKAKREFLILEAASRIGESWRRRWDSLRLFSTAQHSSLPGLAFPDDPRSYPTKDQVADYLSDYADREHLPVQLNTKVLSLDRLGKRYLLTTASKVFECDQVVIATGPYQKPRVPSWAGDLNADIVQVHAGEYKNPSQLAAGDVLVVGAGNTGAEIAVEVAKAGHRVLLSGRDVGQIPQLLRRLGNGALFWFLATRVFTVSTPIGRKIHESVRSGHGGPLVNIRAQQIESVGVERIGRVNGVREGLPLLDENKTLRVQNVIWCTGFGLDFSWVRLPIFAADGYPIHDRGRVTSQSGLYFLGLPFQHSMSSTLIGGVGRDAKLLAKWILNARPLQE